MIHDDLIPAGTYSVSFQSTWQQPFIGKSGYGHTVVTIHDDVDEHTLARMICNELTETDQQGAVCTLVRIRTISRLDSQ